MDELSDPDRQRNADDRWGHTGDEVVDNEFADVDDLIAVWKDDLLLDELGAEEDGDCRLELPFDMSTDRELVDLLLAWTRAMRARSTPMSDAVPTVEDQLPGVERMTEGRLPNLEPVGANERAHPVIAGSDSVPGRPHVGQGSSRSVWWLRFPAASAAAALVLVLLSVVYVAGVAEPDAALRDGSGTLASTHAISLQAAHLVDTKLADARQAMAAGRHAEAAGLLDQANRMIGLVRADDGKSALEARQQALMTELDRSTSNPQSHPIPTDAGRTAAGSSAPGRSGSTSAAVDEPTRTAVSSPAPSPTTPPSTDKSTPPTVRVAPVNKHDSGTGGPASSRGGGPDKQTSDCTVTAKLPEQGPMSNKSGAARCQSDATNGKPGIGTDQPAKSQPNTARTQPVPNTQ